MNAISNPKLQYQLDRNSISRHRTLDVGEHFVHHSVATTDGSPDLSLTVPSGPLTNGCPELLTERLRPSAVEGEYAIEDWTRVVEEDFELGTFGSFEDGGNDARINANDTAFAHSGQYAPST